MSKGNATAGSIPRLILADSHTLKPYSVQGFQFLARAASFAEHWPGTVNLWLPGPELEERMVLSVLGLQRLPTNLAIRFGPAPRLRIGPLNINSKAGYRMWLRRQAWQVLEEEGQAAFYFRTIKLADALVRLSGVFYFFEPHEIFFETAKSPEKFRKLEERVYRAAAHLFAISHGLSKSITRLFPGLEVTVAPLGHSGLNLSLPAYDPIAEPRLLYIGSLLPWKGLETVFAAANEVGVPFDVIGDAGGLKFYQEFCRSRNYTMVHFHGHVSPDQLPTCYRPGSICVLPLTRSEIAMHYTSPLKLFEYLASGRPLLAGDVPSVREIVQNGKEAVLVEPENTQKWAEALRDLIHDRQKAASMAYHARQLARQCTWSARAKQVVGTMLTHLPK